MRSKLNSKVNPTFSKNSELSVENLMEEIEKVEEKRYSSTSLKHVYTVENYELVEGGLVFEVLI